MKTMLVLSELALLLVSGCNITLEPPKGNIQVSQNGNTLTISQNNPTNLAKPVESNKPAEETKKVERNKKFSSHYVDLDTEKCDPIDPNVGVRSMEYRCLAYSGNGQDYFLRSDYSSFENMNVNTSNSGRMWSIEVRGDENRIPLVPSTACPTFGDRIVGISWGKKLELLIYEGQVFAAIARIKCHVEPQEREYSNDPGISDEWKVTKEMLMVGGVGDYNNIGGFDIDVKTTPNPNDVARQRAEKEFMDLEEKGQ